MIVQRKKKNVQLLAQSYVLPQKDRISLLVTHRVYPILSAKATTNCNRPKIKMPMVERITFNEI